MYNLCFWYIEYKLNIIVKNSERDIGRKINIERFHFIFSNAGIVQSLKKLNGKSIIMYIIFPNIDLSCQFVLSVVM